MTADRAGDPAGWAAGVGAAGPDGTGDVGAAAPAAAWAPVGKVHEPADTAGTGDARVDEAIAPLDRLAGAALDEHPAIFEEVHDRLRGVLGELNPGQPGGTGAP
jgi:hypothetical protein